MYMREVIALTRRGEKKKDWLGTKTGEKKYCHKMDKSFGKLRRVAFECVCLGLLLACI